MMAEGLIAMAEYGQAVAVTPFTLMGAMSPVTLAGALAQQNAEALFGVTLTQLIRPGTPVHYGAFTSNVDMRSGAPAFGTPENTKANIASGQLARRYNLPYRTTPGSASNAADAQGAYETMMALWGAVLGHGNLIYHAAGWQEGGLTASLRKADHRCRDDPAHDGVSAPDRGERGGAGARGAGQGADRRPFLRRAAYAGALFDRVLPADGLELAELIEAWQEAGGAGRHGARDAAVEEGAGGICRSRRWMSRSREGIDAYVAKRQEEIGAGEP